MGHICDCLTVRYVMKHLARRFRKRNRCEPCCFSWYVRIVARTAFVILNNLYSIPAYVIWIMALRFIRPLNASLYWKIEGYMFHWLLSMVSMWLWMAGYEIVESGDEPAVCVGHRTLVLANHQSTGDVPTLMSAWAPREKVLANLMWIMDHVFKYTNFGLVSLIHQDFFLQAGRTRRDQSLHNLRMHMHEAYLPLHRSFIVLFPEGGFLRKRREVSNRFAEKNNLPKLKNVTLPRTGAMRIIMEEMGPKSDGPSTSNALSRGPVNSSGGLRAVDEERMAWILDVTIAYEDREPLHLKDIVCGLRAPCTTHLHYRLYPASEVPLDAEGMTNWLYDRFVEKDTLLEEFYLTGKFPRRGSAPDAPRPVRQDVLFFLIVHLFFITSTIVQYKAFNFLYNCFW